MKLYEMLYEKCNESCFLLLCEVSGKDFRWHLSLVSIAAVNWLALSVSGLFSVVRRNAAYLEM